MAWRRNTSLWSGAFCVQGGGKRASMVAECVVDGKRCVFVGTNPKKTPWLLMGCNQEAPVLVLKAALEQLVFDLRHSPADERQVAHRERKLKLSESDGGSQPQNNAGDAGGDSEPEDLASFTGGGSQPQEMAASASPGSQPLGASDEPVSGSRPRGAGLWAPRTAFEASPAKRRCLGTWRRAAVGPGEVQAMMRDGPGAWVVASEEAVRLLCQQVAFYVKEKDRACESAEATLDHGRVRWCHTRSAWVVTYRLEDKGRVLCTYKGLGAKYEERMSMLPKARARWNMMDGTRKERYST